MRHSIFLMNQNIPSYACVGEAFGKKKLSVRVPY